MTEKVSLHLSLTECHVLGASMFYFYFLSCVDDVVYIFKDVASGGGGVCVPKVLFNPSLAV